MTSTVGTRARALVVVLAALAGCSPHAADAPPVDDAALLGDAYIEAELEAFRNGLPSIDTLSWASDSMDDLVERFARTLAEADTSAFAYMTMSRQEFAWMYYPHTRYVSRPYELPADVVWMNLQNRSSRGLARVLERYSGEALTGLRYRCPDAPEVEGPNNFWHGCVLLTEPFPGQVVEERAFGSIWERDGRFKLVSFGNEY